DDHLPLRRRRSLCARSREPAKNGLQKCAINGRRPEGLESDRSADDQVVAGEPALTGHLHERRDVTTGYALCHCVFVSSLARWSTLRKSPPCSPPISRTIRSQLRASSHINTRPS